MSTESRPSFIHTPEQTQKRLQISRELGAYLATISVGNHIDVQVRDQLLDYKEVCQSLLRSFEEGSVFLHINPNKADGYKEAKVRQQVITTYLKDKFIQQGYPENILEAMNNPTLEGDFVCLSVGPNPQFDLKDRSLCKTLCELYLLDSQYPIGDYSLAMVLEFENAKVVRSNSMRVYRLTSHDPITFTNPNVGLYISE